MSNYTENIRLDLLKDLENKEITEAEFWEYYNEAIGDYSESQQAEYDASVYK